MKEMVTVGSQLAGRAKVSLLPFIRAIADAETVKESPPLPGPQAAS
jgi:hypothetical protein